MMKKNPKFIKNSRIARYEYDTDTIYADSKTSITYYHELGHREWAKKSIEQNFQIITWYIIIAYLVGEGLKSGSLLGALFLSIPAILLCISEIHAWFYAIWNYRF